MNLSPHCVPVSPRLVSRRSYKSGFTLIELLVVIAIIAILAAILFPVFGRARENARRASCQSNLKQMSIAMLQYTQDYDERYPSGYFDTTDMTPPPGGSWITITGKMRWFWPQILFPYHKSTQVFVCPSQGVSTWSKGPYISHYGINTLVAPQPPSTGAAVTLNLASVAAPATLYTMFDSGNYTLGAGDVKAPADNTRYLPGQGAITNATFCSTANAALQNDCQSGRHFGGVNMGFADGHVKFVKAETARREAQLFVGTSSVTAWNPATSPG
jgi:prepilin-type N-terminal cleavage/methylation domain-containing protein/prepilin-type processing-associated H-X9-DG protein